MSPTQSTKVNDIEGRRISLTVSEETFRRYSNLPWGSRNKIVEKALLMFLEGYEKHDELFIGAIMSDNVKFDLNLPEKP